MATSTGKVLCRYYMSNACSKGPLCPFSHDWKNNPDMVCRYYLRGSCSYGASCRYDHVRPKEQTEKVDTVSSVRMAGPVSLPSMASERVPPTAVDSNFVKLRKDPTKTPKQWIKAPEFVPGKKFHSVLNEPPPCEEEEEVDPMQLMHFSYSDVASSGTEFLDIITPEEAASLLCPFAEKGVCPFGESCEYLHGEECDMCSRQCLNPFDPEQQKEHKRQCLRMHEIEMERAFLEQGSEGKMCGVCMEVVKTKPQRSERRFGILSDCDHCFCLTCIRKWRSSTHTAKKTIRACPLCRTVSYFVIPSEVWMDDPTLKLKLVEDYKSNLSKKHCKYFDMGKGTCPFGNHCFYRHEYPDGTKAVITARVGTNAEGESKVIQGSLLWDFFSEREQSGGEFLIQPTESWEELEDNSSRPPPASSHHRSSADQDSEGSSD